MATEKQIDKYWKERIDNRQYTAEQLGIKAEVEIIKIYEKALRNINQDIADVYEKYASKVGLGVDELSILLNSKEQSDFTRSIQSKMQKLGFNIEDIYLPNYIARLSRLDALKQQIYWKIAEIGAEEEPIHEELYTKIVKDTYKQYQKDVVNVGIKPTFATLDNRMVNQMVKERWYGRNYSDSVWQNTTKLAETLPEKIGAALTMGRSYMKTANELLPLVSEEFDNAMYAATRLVRTETIFHLNQAEAQASIDDGYTEYEYYAKVGSERTCEICEDLDGRIFKYTELKVGVNYPPIHPNCRCNTRSAAKLTVPQMEKLSTNELKERYQISGGRIVPILPELPLSEVQTGELTVAGDIEKRWKESSAVKSKDKYNDEMNRISKLPTEEFKKKFDALIKKVPEDYPLRKSLINTAKMIGWEEENILTSVNPTGTVFTKYDAKTRATAKLADNITTLDKTMEADPDEVVTIYRGVPAKYKEINAGDFVTTNKQLARDYAGNGVVLEKQVKLSELLDDKDEPLGEEYIYRPKEVAKAAPKTVKVDKDLEQDLELYKNMKTLDLERKIKHATIVKEQSDRNIKAMDNKLAEGGITQQQYDEWIARFGQTSGERLEDLQVKRKELETMTPEQYRAIRDEKEKQLTENFKNIGVEGELTDFEKRIAVAGDIKLSGEVGKHKMRGAGAFYNDESKTIYYTSKGIKQNKEALTKTFFHEFGHAIDTNYVDEKKNKQKLSDTTEWLRTLNADQDEMVYELQQSLDKSPFWKGVTLDQTRTAMRGMEVLFKGRFCKLPNASYYRRKEEIFARSYAVYRTKNKEFRDKMPNIFKYFDELTGYEQQ